MAGASQSAHCCGERRTGLGWCTCARQARRTFFFFRLKSISGSASSPMLASGAWSPPLSATRKQKARGDKENERHSVREHRIKPNNIILSVLAPEGCQRGTHTNETAYPLGTYASVHTQTHSSARQSTRSINPRTSALSRRRAAHGELPSTI